MQAVRQAGSSAREPTPWGSHTTTIRYTVNVVTDSYFKEEGPSFLIPDTLRKHLENSIPANISPLPRGAPNYASIPQVSRGESREGTRERGGMLAAMELAPYQVKYIHSQAMHARVNPLKPGELVIFAR